jgi:hypothetical protein
MKKLLVALISLGCVLLGPVVFAETLKLIHIFKDGTRLSAKMNKGAVVGWVAQDAKGKVDPGTVVGWVAKEHQGKPTQIGALKQSIGPGVRIPRPGEEEIKRVLKAIEEDRKKQQQQKGAPLESGVKCYICRNDNYGHLKCEVVPCDSMPQMEAM